MWHVCLITGKRSDKQKDSGKEVGVVTVGTGEVGGGRGGGVASRGWRVKRREKKVTGKVSTTFS